MRLRRAVRTALEPVLGERGMTALRQADRRVRRTRRRWEDRRAAAREQQRRADEAARGARELAAISGDLTALATHFRTDKWGAHRYTPHYQRHLEHLRDRPVRLLEIGIGGYSRKGDGGASLRMWKHFFPQGQVVGLDLADKSFVEEDRIRAYRGDQSDPELLRRIVQECGPFDVVVDDGSHRPEHVIASFGVLFPLLAEDGLYAVEDTQTSYWPEWGGQEDPEAPDTSMAMLKRLLDGLNHVEYVLPDYAPTYTDRHVVAVHAYHNLVVVEKGRNDEGTRKTSILKRRYAPAAP